MRVNKGFEQIDDLSSAVSLTVPPGANEAFVVVKGGEVMWKDHGDDPTVSVGMPIQSNGFLNFDNELEKLRFISPSASLHVSYYRNR